MWVDDSCYQLFRTTIYKLVAHSPPSTSKRVPLLVWIPYIPCHDRAKILCDR